MSLPDEVTPTTTPGPDAARTPVFKRTALIILAASGALSLLIGLLAEMNRSTAPMATRGDSAATSQGALAGKRLVPKFAGSKSGGGLPILIYRLADEDASTVWLRPEGGGMLRGAAPEDVIPTTEAVAYCDARIKEDPRDPLAGRCGRCSGSISGTTMGRSATATKPSGWPRDSPGLTTIAAWRACVAATPTGRSGSSIGPS
jgi:hypothetical protein